MLGEKLVFIVRIVCVMLEYRVYTVYKKTVPGDQKYKIKLNLKFTIYVVKICGFSSFLSGSNLFGIKINP